MAGIENIEILKSAFLTTESLKLDQCLSQDVHLLSDAFPQGISGRESVIDILRQSFTILTGVGVKSSLVLFPDLPGTFQVSYLMEVMVQVPYYMVSGRSISLCLCLEPKLVYKEFIISAEVDSDLITSIKIKEIL